MIPRCAPLAKCNAPVTRLFLGNWRSSIAVVGAGGNLRGGGWNNNRRNARCAYRNRNEPDNFNDNLGFRVVSHDPDGRPVNPALPAEAASSGPRLGRRDGAEMGGPLARPSEPATPVPG
ncbi:MAG: hypothetical protein JXA78_08915 [Anaerolineales bacterium]|nr:hypothetical protein [Anaerolineales bacterium]